MEDFVEIDLLKKDVKPFYMIPEKYQTSTLASGMISSSILIREKELSLIAKKHLKQALPFQIEELLPYEMKDALTSFRLIPQSKTHTLLQLVATKKEQASQELHQLNHLGIELDFLGNEFFALVQCAQFLHGKEFPLAVFYISKQRLVFVLTKNQHILLTYSADLSPLLFEENAETVSSLPQHLLRLFAYLEEKKLFSAQELKLVVFTDKVSLQKLVSEKLDLPLSDKKEEELKLFSQCFAIGYALQAYYKEHNFFSAIFPSTKIVKKRKKALQQMLCYTALCLLCLFAGKEAVSYFQLNNFSKRIAKLCDEPLTFYKKEELDLKLKAIQKNLQREKEEFSFLFTYPTASDVLAWLSSHPVLCKIDEKTKQKSDISHLHYLVMEEEGKISGVKLEFDVNFPSELLLKEFQKSLEKESFIESLRPISFKQSHLNAHFSVFLSNQIKEEV